MLKSGALQFGHGSHIGRVREGNEDCYGFDAAAGLFVVADGMGGVRGGAVASRIVVDGVLRDVTGGVPLKEAIRRTHDAVEDAARRGEGAIGMGATVVVLKLDGLHYEIAWVGDSRGYLWNGTLSQLTHDHSLLQRMIDAGLIDEASARGHPARNVVSQAVGSADDGGLVVESVRGALKAGDQILLCTDGLNGEVSDDRIAAVLAQEADEQTRVDRLIEAALDSGGSDNVTVILVTVPGQSSRSRRRAGGRAMRGRRGF